MKVFIAGATGRVAHELILRLSKKGYEVVAGARVPEKVQIDNVKAVHLDLCASAKELADVIRGFDAVYFVAGSRGKNLLQVDAFGAVKLMQACEINGIKRFILLSSIFADEPEKWVDPALVNIMDYNIAKFFADQWLIRNTNLDYTIIQPGNLQEIKASGKVNLHVEEKSVPNAIGNVAMVLAEVLEASNTFGKIIKMSDGNEDISTAVKEY